MDPTTIIQTSIEVFCLRNRLIWYFELKHVLFILNGGMRIL